MSNLIFEEKAHIYYLEGQEDKPFTGVTSVLGVIAKPALIQWAANMACDYITNNFPTFEELQKRPTRITEIIKEARTAHKKKKESAGDIGTEVHKTIEEWIKEKKEPILNEQGMTMFQNFKKWAEDNNIKFLDSERRLYSETHWLAGTCDFTCEIKGKKYVGDLKTSSGIYGRDYFAQCAAYRLMLEEMGEKDYHGTIIVRCGKDGSFEVKESFDYETDRDYFLAALKIYRITNNY